MRLKTRVHGVARGFDTPGNAFENDRPVAEEHLMFNAIVIDRIADAPTATLRQVDAAQLPAGNVTVAVDYSTLNYKDALAITNRSPIVRSFPMVPGIDFAGRVEASDDARYAAGDLVILNGWGVGETHWGGLAQRARVSGDWLIAAPAGIDARQAMSIGTAGYTAMLSVQALIRHGVQPGDGEVLVTGANGGVGSIAIMLLARHGYRVVASTGRPAETDRLTRLGASDVIDRATLAQPGKPLGKERWAAAVDCVGSHTLANICATTRYGGVVTACGLAQGMDFPASVAPFILRGVTLVGIDSVRAPRDARLSAWSALADAGIGADLAANTTEIGLADAVGAATDLLDGRVIGRLLVDVNR
jgi:acrylyl-CoA reductase (NADPH)